MTRTDTFERDVLSVHKTHIDEYEAHYEIRSIDVGYATALGNALRRVLLSSLPGAAITSVHIVGAHHEYQDIPHVVEDVTDIVFNLKKVRLRSFTDHPVIVRMDVRGEQEVTAADLLVPSSIEIVNPDVHIATLDNEHAHLVMELTVGTGRGFVSADAQAASTMEAPPIGVILTDAIYSPIVKAHFRIEPLYQGRRDQTASIYLEITTDGTISPDEALRESAAILERQFGIFVHYQHQEDSLVWKRPSSSEIQIPKLIYEMSIEDLNLSARAYNCLKRFGITMVGALLEMDKTDLLGIRNVGEKVIQELEQCLWEHHVLPEGEEGERGTK